MGAIRKTGEGPFRAEGQTGKLHFPLELDPAFGDKSLGQALPCGHPLQSAAFKRQKEFSTDEGATEVTTSVTWYASAFMPDVFQGLATLLQRTEHINGGREISNVKYSMGKGGEQNVFYSKADRMASSKTPGMAFDQRFSPTPSACLLEGSQISRAHRVGSASSGWIRVGPCTCHIPWPV